MVTEFTIEGAYIDTNLQPDNRRSLTILEIVDARVLSVQTRNQQEMDIFCNSKLGRTVVIGRFAISDSVTWLRYSPNALLIVMPGVLADTRGIESSQCCTEISHGKSLLTISGSDVRKFFRDYCSADIGSFNLNQPDLYKTLFLDYEILIWQESKQQLNLLVDRSYAYSFVRLMNSLLQHRNTVS